MTRSILLAITLASALSACSKESAAPADTQAASKTPAVAAAPAAPAVPAAPVSSQNTGKVVQSQNGGGYTYAEVEMANGQKVWIAGSQIDVKPGSPVEWGEFAVMRNFNAKSLNRTFPEILFVNRWGPVGAATVATPQHGTFPAPGAQGAPAAAGPTESGVVKSVSNAGGYSYIEVDRGGKTVWVAAMETPMKPGDKVQWQGGTEMSNFTAKSIGRTFDKIIFASGVNVTQ